MIDISLIEAVLKHADIVDVISSYIKVIRKGKSYVAVCPFHQDTNPSLQISKEKQIFKCFVCGKGGDAVKFVQEFEHIPYFDALRKVAEISGYSDPRLEKKKTEIKVDPVLQPLKKCLKDLTAYYKYALSTDEGVEGLEYLENRHLDARMREKYSLGYAFKDGRATVRFLESKGNSLKTQELAGVASSSGTDYKDRYAGRVIFPLFDINGEPVGYSARRIAQSDTAKYLNSPETKLFHKSSVLYNFHNAKEVAKQEGYVYILEGFMDVFALDRIGIYSAVALMGTAFTSEHIRLLRMLNVELRICLDGDGAGQHAEMEMIKSLKDSGLKYRFVDNAGSSKDPDEILNQDGDEALRAYLNNLLSPVDFMLSYYKRTSPVTSLEARKKLIIDFIPIMLSVKSALEFEDYLRKLANISKFDVDLIRDIIQKAKNKGNDGVKEVALTFKPERKALRRFELAEREILFHMLNDKKAVEFYEEKIETFFDELYRKIADYLIEYYEKHEDYSITSFISFIELSEDPKSEEMVSEITSISFEKNHPLKCDMELLESVKDTIMEERNKLHEKSVLERAMEGKSELEKARILADYNRLKMRRARRECKDDE